MQWHFNVFIGKVIREVKRDFVREIRLWMIENEIVAMTKSVEELQSNLGVMSEVLRLSR